MDFTILPKQLQSFARSANFIIKSRYNLPDGIIEESVHQSIPLRPTLHWKTNTKFIICEVAERPFPTSIKESFAEIIGLGEPIKIIVAYPSENELTSTDYQNDIKECKKFGIGYMGVDEYNKGEIEYSGISPILHIHSPDLKKYKKKLQPSIREIFEIYMKNAKPDDAIQEIGQLTEDILYNVAKQAKKKGNFSYEKFKPPRPMNSSELIDHMIKENVIDVSILGRCKAYAKDRNKVSHKPKSRKQAREIENNLKDNYIIGMRILEDLPDKIKERGYRLIFQNNII